MIGVGVVAVALVTTVGFSDGFLSCDPVPTRSCVSNGLLYSGGCLAFFRRTFTACRASCSIALSC